ncbi:hypothetical protein BpHYR1_033763 [Brachionus plicatilis]|uniref:Uncharacterized protein n=1 Tax=Brachionus plicatilis TaxID=10195 RepID=A0A3M7P1Y7_BRAPC|nr:hypothetical protein BpHYR1_033763 [Brachionus plicatilis]
MSFLIECYVDSKQIIKIDRIWRRIRAEKFNFELKLIILFEKQINIEINIENKYQKIIKRAFLIIKGPDGILKSMINSINHFNSKILILSDRYKYF